jgi:hypothetical protein
MGFFGDTLAGEDIIIAAAVDLGNLAGKATGSVPHPTLNDAHGKPVRIANGVPDPDQSGFVLPASVTEVRLLGDSDSEIFATAARMAVATRRVMDKGVEVFVHFPPTPGLDWNDQLLKGTRALMPPEPLPANASYTQKVAAFQHPIRTEKGAEFLARVSFLLDPPEPPDPGKPNFRSLAEFKANFARSPTPSRGLCAKAAFTRSLGGRAKARPHSWSCSPSPSPLAEGN